MISLVSNTTSTPDEELSRSLWTAGSFTDMVAEDFSNESSWVAPLSPEESSHTFIHTSAYNGDDGGTHLQENFNKRPRSPSPLVAGQSAPPHKKHKSHKSSSKRAKREFQPAEDLTEFVVHIPLDKVHLRGLTEDHRGLVEDRRGLTDSQKQLTKNESEFVGRVSVQDHKELTSEWGLTEKCNTAAQNYSQFSDVGSSSRADLLPRPAELVVSFRRSLLRRVPREVVKLEFTAHPTDTSAALQSHDKRSWSHEGVYESQESSLKEFLVNHKPVDMEVSVEAKDHALVPHLPLVQRRPPPEGVCPGVDGCIGLDGYWYEWTEHMVSRDSEVTVMPYVYFEDCDSTASI